MTAALIMFALGMKLRWARLPEPFQFPVPRMETVQPAWKGRPR